MYGLINISIKNLILEEHGDGVWKKILKKADLSDQYFVSNQKYDDKLTFALVMAASEVLEVSIEDILKKFGQYWVLNVAPNGYGNILDASGSSLFEFLENLPNLHNRVVLIYPELRPPVFKYKKISEDKCLVYYGSDREGLIPFVIGLLEGLCMRFKIETQIKYNEFCEDSSLHEFEIQVC